MIRLASIGGKLLLSDAALVDRLSDDHGTAADAAEFFHISDRRNPAARDQFEIGQTRDDPLVEPQRWPGHCSVAADIGHESLTDAAGIHEFQEIEYRNFRFRLPSIDGDLFVSAVGPQEDAITSEFIQPSDEGVGLLHSHAADVRYRRPG